MGKNLYEALATTDNDSTPGGAVTGRRPVRTRTEIHFTNALVDLLKEQVEADSEGSNQGLTYGHSILASVVFERYDHAVDELETLLDLQKDYPTFGQLAGRYIQHAKSLVRAIKAKRGIGRLPHISKTKQKELMQTLAHHFTDLRSCVLNIEKIERRVRKEDLSSTRYFIWTVYWSLFFLFMGSFLVLAAPYYYKSIYLAIVNYITDFFMWLVGMVWPV